MTEHEHKTLYVVGIGTSTGGLEALEKFFPICPRSSGYSNDPVMANYKLFGFKGVGVKPYQIQELSECWHTVLKG